VAAHATRGGDRSTPAGRAAAVPTGHAGDAGRRPLAGGVAPPPGAARSRAPVGSEASSRDAGRSHAVRPRVARVARATGAPRERGWSGARRSARRPRRKRRSTVASTARRAGRRAPIGSRIRPARVRAARSRRGFSRGRRASLGGGPDGDPRADRASLRRRRVLPRACERAWRLVASARLRYAEDTTKGGGRWLSERLWSRTASTTGRRWLPPRAPYPSGQAHPARRAWAGRVGRRS
jgi:hypothetical protein